MRQVRRFINSVGSLWFAAVLLVLLSIAMACATAYESTTSAEQALALFYQSWWFHGLLWLFAINNAAAIATRWPFKPRHVGFIMTHGSILVILGGALVTYHFGVEGRVWLAEGQTARRLLDPHSHQLRLIRQSDNAAMAADLPAGVFGRFSETEYSLPEPLELNGVSVQVQHFVPDGEWTRRVEESPDERGGPAVEVSITNVGVTNTAWLMPRLPVDLPDTRAALRVSSDPAEFAAIRSGAPATGGAQVIASVGEEEFALALHESLGHVMTLGDTGYSVRIVRHMTHATVTAQRSVIDNPERDQPNPAVEVEVSDGQMSERRFVFAKFPQFKLGGHDIEGITLRLEMEATEGPPPPQAPLEIVLGPDQQLLGRVTDPHGGSRIVPLEVGQPTTLPGTTREILVRQVIEHARTWREFRAVTPVREERSPAMRVAVTTRAGTQTQWLELGRALRFSDGQETFEVEYGNRPIALDFDLRLLDFRLGRYPGTGAPRTFESVVDLHDIATGRERYAVITMNEPFNYGGFDFFQSSYQQTAEGEFSMLSASRDPGRLIVYLGYCGLMAGMLVVMGTRISEHNKRRRAGVMA